MTPTLDILTRDLTPEEQSAMARDLVNRNAAQRLADANVGLMEEVLFLRKQVKLLKREIALCRFIALLAVAAFLGRLLEVIAR